MMTEAEVERLFLLAAYSFEEENDRRNEIHVSDLTNPCIRAVWYEKKRPLPPSPENALRMLEGKLLHKVQVIPGSTMEMAVEFEGVKGRVDEYKDGVILEKKYVDFVPSTLAEVQRYYGHYIEQVGFYAFMLVSTGHEFKQALLHFAKRGEQNERGRYPFKTFDVTSLIDLDKVEAEFYNRKTVIAAALKRDEPPEVPANFSPNSYPCSYCKYVAICYSGVR